MFTLPVAIIDLLEPFAALFDSRTWRKAETLLVGAILSPGKRTVTSALRVMGLTREVNFAQYHHVLNRAVWSPLQVSRVLLCLLMRQLDRGDGPLVFGIDETLERRRGKRIRAKGIYRDGVRSSASHFVKASGLRWVSLMWLGRIPWAHQMIIQLRRWLPQRALVIVADSSYAVLDLLHFCQSLLKPVTFITRLRLDAALYDPAPPRGPRQIGRPRLKGRRLPTLKELLCHSQTVWTTTAVNWYDRTQRMVELASCTAVWYHRGKAPVPIRWVLIRDPQGDFHPQALLCTDLHVEAPQIIEWFVLRWQLEVTFQEVRTHLGVETQRQWSDLTIARTTPALFGLFSWVTLATNALRADDPVPVRSAAWYPKSLPTFSDAIALVRQHLWACSDIFDTSAAQPDIPKLARPMVNRFIESLCYAA